MVKLKQIFSSIIFYLSILTFIIGFNFSDTMLNGWYQQFMPNIGGRTIQDITFLDSLTGYASARQSGDTSYILKTTNGGDNWEIIYRNFLAMTQIQFLNINTGYAVGAYLFKTINSGFNWSQVTAPAISPEELYVINEDTIWIISSNSLTGGVYRTTNGGVSWDRQLNLGSQNPDHIYMFNGRLGFIAKNGSYVRRTSDGGLSWTPVINGNDGITDMYFVDSLTGWKAYGTMKKTTDGGFNWVTQTFPLGGMIQGNGITSFSNINRDTIWGNGGYLLYPNNHITEFLNRTTNGGTNWLIQIPDSSYQISYKYVNFTNKLNGWVYNIATGIHTTTGGNDTFYTSVKQINSNTPNEFKIEQNYPNPFNPITNFKLRITDLSDIKVNVYDVNGKLITILVDKQMQAGEYLISFDGTNYSSGIYFYSLYADGILIDTKRMVLIK
jgi:photosystem II stability/assembly factor-like uncharacterized protein